jgi:hypothetical protein
MKEVILSEENFFVLEGAVDNFVKASKDHSRGLATRLGTFPRDQYNLS